MKVKTFSQYNLIDVKDLMRKIYKHLLKTNQQFCFYKGRLISRETCKKYV